MSFLLDTNIASVHLKRPRGLIHRFVQHAGHIYISSVALAELNVWAWKKPDPRPTLAAIDLMLENEVRLIDFDYSSANEFGRLKVEMNRSGRSVSPIDLLIASVALVYDFTLVTNNISDFRQIPGLRLEDWLESSR